MSTGGEPLTGLEPKYNHPSIWIQLHSLSKQSVRVLSKTNADISLMKKDGLLCVNILNLNGEHADVNVCGFDDIPALRDIELEIYFAEKTQLVRLEPENVDLPYTWENSIIKVNNSLFQVQPYFFNLSIPL